jgi:hypothetical protein
MEPKIYRLLYNGCITIKAHLIGEVEYYNNAIRFFEIIFSEGKEFLLTRRVPNTHRHLVIVN